MKRRATTSSISSKGNGGDVRHGKHWARVTPRERQVLELVAQGLNTKAIAKALGISPQTVEVHRYNMHLRLGAHNVVGLLRIALKEKLITTAQLAGK